MIANREELADLFGVTVRTISRWQNEGMPVIKGHRGRDGNEYDTVDCIEWWSLRGQADTISLAAERARLAKAQADAQELKNEATRLDLLPQDLVFDTLSATLLEVRAQLLAVGTTAAPRVIGLASLPLVKDTVDRAIREALANCRPEVLFRALGFPGEAPGAAPADGEPVGGRAPEVEPGGLGGARAVADEPVPADEGDHGRALGSGDGDGGGGDQLPGWQDGASE